MKAYLKFVFAALLIAVTAIYMWSDTSYSKKKRAPKIEAKVFKEYRPEGTKGGPMVHVPEGDFWMGCNPALENICENWGNASCKCDRENEKPYHEVYLDAYYIDKYEVTVDDYMKCVKDGKCKPPDVRETKEHMFSAVMEQCNWRYSDRGDHPINCVEWFKAKAYCEYAGKRLPTEAEWEKAARGTDGRLYPWGNQKATCKYLIMFDGRSVCGDKRERSWPVGSKPAGASPYGALDMSGNVWEMVADWKDVNYYKNSPRRNPKGPDSQQEFKSLSGYVSLQGRVVRGGMYWDDTGWFNRTSFRGGTPQWDISHGNGFRCAKDD